MSKSNIRQKVVSGSFWTVFSNISSQAITFGVTVILARLLTPEDFGVVAITSVFTGVIMLFQDLGMGSAIIQRKSINDDYLTTSFTVSLLVGILIALALCAASPFIADFYGVKIIEYILIVSSLGFVLSPFVSIHTSLLTKGLDFRKIAFINILTQALSGGFSIALAFLDYGVWSLVLGRIITQPLLIPVVWHIVKWRPRFKIVGKCFHDLFGYSSNLLGFNILNYFSRNFDNLIIGKFLGAQPLGYYSVAYNLMLKPLQLISWSIGKVLFPVFSTIQDDARKTREVYLRIIRTISLVTFPMMTGLIMVSEEFILSVYGPQWRPAIMPLQLLCLVGAVQSVGTTGGVILNSRGRTDITFKLGVFSTGVTLAAFLIGIKWGLLGLIIAYMSVSVPLFLIGQHYVNKLIDLKMTDFLKSLFPATICSMMMVSILYLFKHLNQSSFHLDLSAALVFFIILGAASYALSAFLFRVPEMNEAVQYVRKRF